MEALEALITRRSTRNYRPDPVDPEKLAKILDAGRQAPSGGNNQTSHFFVIRSREVLDRLIRLAEAAFARMEADEHTYASLKHSIAAAKKGGYVFCYNAPVLIAVANRRDYGNNIADCACALENMMVAANALDLGSCWINQLHWLTDEPAVHDALLELGMQPDETCCGAVAVGHAATEDGLPNRVPLPRTGNPVVFVD